MDLEFLRIDPEFYEHLALIDHKLHEKREFLTEPKSNQRLLIYKQEQESIVKKVEEGIEYYSRVKDLLNELRNFDSIDYRCSPHTSPYSIEVKSEKSENEHLMLSGAEDRESMTAELVSQPQPPPIPPNNEDEKPLIQQQSLSTFSSLGEQGSSNSPEQESTLKIEPKYMLKPKYKEILVQKGKTT